jgi:hypothetical protein
MFLKRRGMFPAVRVQVLHMCAELSALVGLPPRGSAGEWAHTLPALVGLGYSASPLPHNAFGSIPDLSTHEEPHTACSAMCLQLVSGPTHYAPTWAWWVNPLHPYHTTQLGRRPQASVPHISTHQGLHIEGSVA